MEPITTSLILTSLGKILKKVTNQAQENVIDRITNTVINNLMKKEKNLGELSITEYKQIVKGILVDQSEIQADEANKIVDDSIVESAILLRSLNYSMIELKSFLGSSIDSIITFLNEDLALLLLDVQHQLSREILKLRDNEGEFFGKLDIVFDELKTTISTESQSIKTLIAQKHLETRKEITEELRKTVDKQPANHLYIEGKKQDTKNQSSKTFNKKEVIPFKGTDSSHSDVSLARFLESIIAFTLKNENNIKIIGYGFNISSTGLILTTNQVFGKITESGFSNVRITHPSLGDSINDSLKFETLYTRQDLDFSLLQILGNPPLPYFDNMTDLPEHASKYTGGAIYSVIVPFFSSQFNVEFYEEIIDKSAYYSQINMRTYSLHGFLSKCSIGTPIFYPRFDSIIGVLGQLKKDYNIVIPWYIIQRGIRTAIESWGNLGFNEKVIQD